VRVAMAYLAQNADRHSATRSFTEIRNRSDHAMIRTKREQSCNTCDRPFGELAMA
jgi:hypothetical protein